MYDSMKTIKSIKDSGPLLKGVIKTTKNEKNRTKRQIS